LGNQQQRRIHVKNADFIRELYGSFDENIKLIKQLISIDVITREGEIILIGEDEDVLLGEQLIEALENTVIRGESLNNHTINYIYNLLIEGKGEEVKNVAGDVVIITAKGKPVKPKTLGQKNYIKEIEKKDLVFGIGPAGTGKTYLAVAMAVQAFKNEEVNRIILTRPAVEAGESLGFLPGDLKDKIDPYLRPLYDALFDILGTGKISKVHGKRIN
jgi:phosphate starvation-inducible protein PhoH and related proteins